MATRPGQRSKKKATQGGGLKVGSVRGSFNLGAVVKRNNAGGSSTGQANRNPKAPGRPAQPGAKQPGSHTRQPATGQRYTTQPTGAAKLVKIPSQGGTVSAGSSGIPMAQKQKIADMIATRNSRTTGPGTPGYGAKQKRK